MVIRPGDSTPDGFEAKGNMGEQTLALGVLGGGPPPPFPSPWLVDAVYVRTYICLRLRA